MFQLSMVTSLHVPYSTAFSYTVESISNSALQLKQNNAIVKIQLKKFSVHIKLLFKNGEGGLHQLPVLACYVWFV